MESKKKSPLDGGPNVKSAQDDLANQLQEVVLPQLLGLQYGTLVLVVHQGSIVQLERTEKFRLDAYKSANTKQEMRNKMKRRRCEINLLLAAVLGLLIAEGCGQASNDRSEGGSSKAESKSVELLNVSYDPTRELWKDINARFSADYKTREGVNVTIKQSHGGSSSQARSVIDGLEADVVTLASLLDTDAIAKRGLVREDWLNRLPDRSLPYYSTIVFVVRKGNPKAIKDWPDLIQPGVEVITPNPKTSGNGYLTFFSAWGSVVLRGGNREDAISYLTRLYQQVPVLDSGARAATATFVQKKIGDVHLAWENEAHLEVKEANGELELIYPPISIRAEPHVTLVDANVDRHGTREVAQAYLNYLYEVPIQEVIAKHHYRPTNPEVMRKVASQFPDLRLFEISEIAPDFATAHREIIGEGGVFDSIYKSR